MNPFRDAIVANPWETTRADVPAIHGDVFEECLRGIEHVRSVRRSAALLIHGEAGSGKTHLLSRLRARLAPQAPPSTERRECLYAWVRLQTSPRLIWRTVRRTLVDDWFRPVGNGRSQFDRILFHRLAEIRPAEADLERWYEYMLQEHPDGLQELIQQITDRLEVERNTAVAFEHIAFGRHRRDLQAWLGGTSLPEAALERMGLAQDDGTDEEREDESRRVVLMLCRLAGGDLPIVLSFDQVEALQTASGDRDALFAFGQLISTLHDGTSNVLLVSCVQSAFFSDMKAQVRQADYDRMSSLGALSLDPLSTAQAKELIAARLAANGGFRRQRASDPDCWPLEPEEFAALFAAGPVTPRRLLNRCAERFDARMQPRAEISAASEHVVPDDAASSSIRVDTWLADEWSRCVEAKIASNTAAMTEDIVRHGLPLVVKLAAPDWRLVADDRLPDVPLLLDGPSGRVGVSIRSEANMRSLGTKFGRLREQLASGRMARLVVIRDNRVPLTKAAKVARKNLDDLERMGAAVVFPTLEALAALDALRELLSDAKSGDLAFRGQTILPQTVEEWLKANLSPGLRDFVDGILAGLSVEPCPAETQQMEALSTLLDERPILALPDAAQALAVPTEDLLVLIRRHSDQFGVLGEPPAALFRRVEASDLTA